MKWLSLVVTLLGLFKALVDFLQRRQMIAAAEATILKEAMDDATTKLAAVRAASDAARDDIRAGRVSDDDIGFRD